MISYDDDDDTYFSDYLSSLLLFLMERLKGIFLKVIGNSMTLRNAEVEI